LQLGDILAQNAAQLSELTQSEYEDALRELARQNEVSEEEIESFVNELKDCQDAVKEYQKIHSGAAKEISATTSILASQSKDFKNASAAELALGGEAYKQKVNDLKNTIIENEKNVHSASTTNDKESKELWQRYLEA
jgi:hypothetical protein